MHVCMYVCVCVCVCVSEYGAVTQATGGQRERGVPLVVTCVVVGVVGVVVVAFSVTV